MRVADPIWPIGPGSNRLNSTKGKGIPDFSRFLFIFIFCIFRIKKKLNNLSREFLGFNDSYVNPVSVRKKDVLFSISFRKCHRKRTALGPSCMASVFANGTFVAMLSFPGPSFPGIKLVLFYYLEFM